MTLQCIWQRDIYLAMPLYIHTTRPIPKRVCSVGFEGFRVAQRFKALQLSARSFTTDYGSIPGCLTTGRDRESQGAAHNCPSVVRVKEGLTGIGHHVRPDLHTTPPAPRARALQHRRASVAELTVDGKQTLSPTPPFATAPELFPDPNRGAES